MLYLFEAIRDCFKIKPDSHCIDNWVFQLHYRATTIIFIIASILVTSREYLGEHIKCINDLKNPDGFSKVIETYCFFSSTFTLIDNNEFDKYGYGFLAHPGVGPYGIGAKHPVRKHQYYQWVPFLLFGQAIMFYFTHLLWKQFEDDRIHKLVTGWDLSVFAALKTEDQEIDNQATPSRRKNMASVNRIKNAFLQRIALNKSWAKFLILCEFLNVLNVVFQIYLTDRFLGGQFYFLVPNIIRKGPKIIDEVFPKVTKCTFHKYGASGSIQIHDALCILALNVINEKIYVFLWFWFVALLAASVLILLWRLITILLYRCTRFNRMIFGRTKQGKLYPWDIKTVTRGFGYSDWLLLKYLSKNMDSVSFKELFLNLSEDLDADKKRPLLCFMENADKYGLSDLQKFE